MFKIIFCFCLAIFSTQAAPEPSILAAPVAVAPPIAPAVVTAQSSQVVARTYNAFAAPLVAGPAPVIAAPAFRTPVVAAPAPFIAAPAVRAPVVTSYRIAPPIIAPGFIAPGFIPPYVRTRAAFIG